MIARNIYLVGEICENLTETVLREIKESEEEEWENVDTLNIWISTSGGFLRDCFGIIDLIKDVKKQRNLKINTFGIGEVASAGFFLFILGDKRYLFPNCRVFVHEHMTIGGDAQTYSEREKQDKNEKLILRMYLDYTAERLGITRAKARNLLKKNKWLASKEIKQYGIEKNE